MTSRSSMETSAASETDVEEESRKGEGLRGGRESREKKEGCESDRVWEGVGEMLCDPICC